jgi:hypothetical protein
MEVARILVEIKTDIQKETETPYSEMMYLFSIP